VRFSFVSFCLWFQSLPLLYPTHSQRLYQLYRTVLFVDLSQDSPWLIKLDAGLYIHNKLILLILFTYLMNLFITVYYFSVCRDNDRMCCTGPCHWLYSRRISSQYICRLSQTSSRVSIKLISHLYKDH